MHNPAPQRCYRLHAWTMVAFLVTATSLTCAQIFGQLDGYNVDGDGKRGIITQPTPPAIAVRFGWPVVYLWRDHGGTSQFDDFGNEFQDIPPGDRWAWSGSPQLGFSTSHLIFDISLAVMLLLGVVYTVERCCRLVGVSFRFGIVGLVALSGWAATILVVDGDVKTTDDLITISIRVLLSLRFVILGLFWFGFVDAGCRLTMWLCQRFSSARST